MRGDLSEQGIGRLAPRAHEDIDVGVEAARRFDRRERDEYDLALADLQT